MAIKYKVIIKNKEDSKDSVISKTGHIVLFTMNQMLNNEKDLLDTKAKAEQVIETFNNYLEKLEAPDFDEQGQATVLMFREAELDRDEFSKQLLDPNITEDEIKERNAMIDHREAVMENIKHFHPFVMDLTGEEMDKIREYRKTVLLKKQYTDKLAEIDETLARSAREKEEIIKQTKIKI